LRIVPGPNDFTTEQRRYAAGELVALRADPNVIGAIHQILPGTPEDRYVVFVGSKRSTYYASQLQPIAEEADSFDILPLSEFLARLTALQLSQPSLANLYSLHAARVNFVPYQFRPVLRFVRSDRPRLLIADEVGVGKTIEAGLILRELQARQDVRSVLIICPRPLVKERKWYSEMKRFDEEFVHLDGGTLRHCVAETDLNGEWPEQYRKCIVPFSLFDERAVFGDKKKRQLGLTGLDPFPRFDLVIVDEAHHLRNPNTFLHQGVRLFTENADAAVLLTATPIQLQSEDLFVLLNLLRPDVVLDRQSFVHMSEPNPYLHEAVNVARAALGGWEKDALGALMGAGATPWGQTVLSGSAEYQRQRGLLAQAVDQKQPFTPEARLRFIRETENLHTFAGLINRTRRRDIGSFTTRKPETVEVEFTEEQRALHDALLIAQERILRRCHGDRPMAFLMTTIRRQAASCLYGLAPLIEYILSRRLADMDWETEDEDDVASDLADSTYRTLREEIEAVVEMAQGLSDDDPKRDALLQIVRDKQRMPNNKILLFSSFRHTLRYLARRLAALGNVRVGLIQGDIPDAERSDLRERFSRPKEDPTAIDLLLSSEVGCEGLDYQFCDTMVNYDLPWNPMRVEQRIGRIDRYGQKSETVAIYNLVTPGTVDFDIYTRCLLRIGLFRQALGGSEEVLGRVTRELKAVAENLSLTGAEREARLQQIADNEIRVIQEQAELEEKQAELFGIMLPPQQIAQEVQDASSAWLTPDALQNLVQTYLTQTVGGDDHFQSVQGEKNVKWLRLGQDARNRLLEDYRKLPRQSSPVAREWEKYLKGSEQRIEVTFDAQAAADRRGAVFITPVHPLAQQAAFLQREAPPFHTAFSVPTDAADGIAAGSYPFAIFQWQRRGVRDDALLQPVCADPALTERFLALLAAAGPASDDLLAAFPDPSAFNELEAAHYALWSEARANHQEETRQVVRYRRESLRVSHTARVRLLEQQRDAAGDEKIQRMRGVQIANAEADYERRRAAIDAAEQRADILTQPVAYGVLHIGG
jgi:ATP-dependent helicase HepA